MQFGGASVGVNTPQPKGPCGAWVDGDDGTGGDGGRGKNSEAKPTKANAKKKELSEHQKQLLRNLKSNS